MHSSEWLLEATKQLSEAGIGTARLDALVLLEDVTGTDRARLLAEPEAELPAAQRARLTKLLNCRAQHEPLAYIRGFTEFYGRKFVITPAVLEPRPESETMIDLLKHIVLEYPAEPAKPKNGHETGRPIRIADVGSGSGALGITAQLELPKTVVELLEIDPAALKISKTNVDKFTLNISAVSSDLLSASAQSYDVLLCNLPYVPDGYHINQAALREPKVAIFGGLDGLDIYRKLFMQVVDLPKAPLFILTESLPPQHEQLKAIGEEHGYTLNLTDDFIQVFKSVTGSNHRS